MSALIYERTARATLALGLLALAALAALLALPLAETSPTTTATLRERTRAARSLRADALADDRFDTVVAELASGIGYGAPTDLSPILDHIQLARSFERASGRTPDTDAAIAKSLQRVDDLLAARDASTLRVGASPGTPTATVAFLAAVFAGLAVGIGLVCAVRGASLRRTERLAIAGRLDLPFDHVDDGRFVAQVNMFAVGLVTASRTHRVEVRETSTEVTESRTALPAAGAGSVLAPPTERSQGAETSPYVLKRRPLTHTAFDEEE